MKTTTADAKTFTAGEACTLARFFSRLERMANDEYRRDEETALGMYRLSGSLRVRIFDVDDNGWLVPARSLFEVAA